MNQVLQDNPNVSAEARFERARSHFMAGRGRPVPIDRGPKPRHRPRSPRDGDDLRPWRPKHHKPGPARRGPGRPGGPLHDNDELLKAAKILEQLVDEDPREPEYRHLLACCYREMSPLLFGRETDEDRSLEMAIKVLEGLVQEFPNVADYRFDLSEAYAMIPTRGFLAEPDNPNNRALEISRSLVSKHPNVPDYAAAQVRLLLKIAKHQERTGQTVEAEALLKEAVRIQTSLVEQFPTVVQYQLANAVAIETLASHQFQNDDLAEALDNVEAAITTLERLDDSIWRPRHFREMLSRARSLKAQIESKLDDRPDKDGRGRDCIAGDVDRFVECATVAVWLVE
ncbi:MAG: hypothetical protein MI757_11105 [Pirellulales bacterium]|nr:hypothetical protein [Pirellulales bacterium]